MEIPGDQPPKAFGSLTSITSQPPTLDRKIVYGVQVVTLLLIVVFCLVNLTVTTLAGANEKLWIGLLGSCVGYLLPNPTLKNSIRFS